MNYGLVYKLLIPDTLNFPYLLTTYIYKNRFFFFFWQMLRDHVTKTLEVTVKVFKAKSDAGFKAKVKVSAAG